jgi:hypothetical protein
MLRHLVSALGGLALGLAPALLSAADLPIVRIVIGPNGALVEHEGVLPKDDAVVGGLPMGLDAGQGMAA